MLLMREMPVKAAAKIVSEQDTRLWRVLLHYVEVGLSKEDFSQTSRRRGRGRLHRREHGAV